ncbi:hypothetical protein BJ166DRAFT_595886 [Pestalotiopsis sp. NC0098]|nr:hypothetical protein BJ166DRAFT_595886 [Pestalotiopsis sp. NC0098]
MSSHSSIRGSYFSDADIDQHADGLQGQEPKQVNHDALARLTGEFPPINEDGRYTYQPESPPPFQSPILANSSSPLSRHIDPEPLSPLDRYVDPEPLSPRDSSMVQRPLMPRTGTSSTTSDLRRAGSVDSRLVKTIKRTPTLIKTATMRAGSYAKTAYQHKRDMKEDQKRVPPCKVHNTTACAEHLYWYIGQDVEVVHDKGADVRVPQLLHDDARFEHYSDRMIQPGGEFLARNFVYEEPKRHWFNFCKSCKLVFLKGSAGNAITTHPGHLGATTSASFKFGARAIAVYVDSIYDHEKEMAEWSVYFGPDSPENKVRSSRSIEPKTADMRAIRDALEAVSTSVVQSRRDSLRGKIKSNSEAFLEAACRFNLIIFSPLKATMTLCADQQDRVLQWDEKYSSFYYPEKVPRWVRDRYSNAAWMEEKRRAERAIGHLAQEGIQVQFAYTPDQLEYSEKWRLFAPSRAA